MSQCGFDMHHCSGELADIIIPYKYYFLTLYNQLYPLYLYTTRYWHAYSGYNRVVFR